MSQGRLSPLQERILLALSDFDPPWTLTGGGALVGFHTQHRATRDLDLLWRGRSRLEDLSSRIEERLVASGLDVHSVQRAVSFHRFEVREAGQSCILDLVSESAPGLTDPDLGSLSGRTLPIDSRHEILVNKLCALLGRAEVRDLVDVEVLLRTGGDLQRALADAPRKDSGFSAMTLAWLLSGLKTRAMARADGLDDARAEDLERFRLELVDRLTRSSMP